MEPDAMRKISEYEIWPAAPVMVTRTGFFIGTPVVD
jgi:hypothetical protein